MFGIAAHINNIPHNKASYEQGKNAFYAGDPITFCPTYGTTWDHGAWLAGWLDALAKEVRIIKK